MKTVMWAGAQSDCDTFAASPSMYRGLVCCASDGCNYMPVSGPAPDDPGELPVMRCELIGVRIGTLMSSIVPAGAKGNCDTANPPNCYTMTPAQMKEYIGTPAFVPLEPNHFSCIDGRHDNEIVATPGGDMGLFLSSSFVYINASATPTNFSLPRMKVNIHGLSSKTVFSSFLFHASTLNFHFHE